MPAPIPPLQIAHFLHHHTTPIPLCSLSSTPFAEPLCPLCHNAYTDPPPDMATALHPALRSSDDDDDNNDEDDEDEDDEDEDDEDQPEYAVQVRNHTSCSHVFGRRCLETHVRAGTPWSQACPLCRAVWFHDGVFDGDGDGDDDDEDMLPGGAGRVQQRQLQRQRQREQTLLRDVEDGLRRLAGVEFREREVRRELEEVERALGRVRDVLYARRGG